MKLVIAIYIIGFIAIFALNASIGPVTSGLALMRAAVWPIWIVTGYPQGERMRPMDGG